MDAQAYSACKSGQIKSIGIANCNLTEIKHHEEILFKEVLKLTAAQNHFSLLRCSSEKARIFRLLQKRIASMYKSAHKERIKQYGLYDITKSYGTFDLLERTTIYIQLVLKGRYLN